MQILDFFRYEHLPEKLQAVSKPFGDLASHIAQTVPDCTERDFALRKLLEAKDCAVRANLCQPRTDTMPQVPCLIGGKLEWRDMVENAQPKLNPDEVLVRFSGQYAVLERVHKNA